LDRSIKTNEGITLNNIAQFVELWMKVHEVHLIEGIADDITQKFTTSGSYPMASAYRAQFEGMINSFMPEVVWRNWAPPKCNFFT
jgi:hypothetical protein